MTDFSVELDIVRQEIRRLGTEVQRMRTEYDLDDGVNDDEEQAEIDALDMAIRDLQNREGQLVAASRNMLPMPDVNPAIVLEEIEIVGATDIYDVELQQFFGTRTASWAGRCARDVLDARSQLNVDIPDQGLTIEQVSGLYEIMPAVGQYVAATRTVLQAVNSAMSAVDTSAGQSFADVGAEMSAAWSRYQADMDRDSPTRQESYSAFAEAYRASNPSTDISVPEVRRAIETYVAGFPEGRLFARHFLLECMKCLDDPWIEPDSLWEEEGYETGDVSLQFHLRNRQFSLVRGYIDDAPQQLVDALKRNYGAQTCCMDLPLAMRMEIIVFFRDRGHPRETDEEFHVSIDLRRRSRTPGNESFDVTLPRGTYEDMDTAIQQGWAEFLSQKPFNQVSLGQLSGD